MRVKSYLPEVQMILERERAEERSARWIIGGLFSLGLTIAVVLLASARLS